LFKGSMWHVDGTHNTLITTGNGGSEPTTAQVTLFYNDGQGKYRIEKPLSPGQQLWLDVGELIRNQVPDSDGHTMPPDTMTGSYELRDMDHPLVGLLYEGKLVIDKTFGHASYGCGRCCGYGPPAFVTNPFTGPPSNDYFDNVQAYDHCGNFMDDVTNAGYTWASSNTPVATLSSPTLHTVAVGTATGSTHFYLDSNTAKNCVPTYTTPQQPVYVGAYQVEPIATASQGPVAAGNCPTNQYPGYVRYVTNQVQYQTGAAYALSGLSVADTLTTGSRHDLGSGASTGTANRGWQLHRPILCVFVGLSWEYRRN